MYKNVLVRGRYLDNRYALNHCKDDDYVLWKVWVNVNKGYYIVNDVIEVNITQNEIGNKVRRKSYITLNKLKDMLNI